MNTNYLLTKIKVLALILSLGLFLSINSLHAHQTMNLIQNGSFEWRTASSGTPTYWRFYSNEGATFQWMGAGNQRTGGYCCHVNRPTASGGDTLLDNWDDMVPVTAGMNYKLKFAAKGSGTLVVKLGWQNSSGGVISESSNNYSLASSYSKQEISVTAPAGAARSWVAFRLSGTGSFYIDDVAMWVDPGSEKYPTGYVNMGRDRVSGNLSWSAPAGGDGDAEFTHTWDKECQATQPSSSDFYLYFDVADGFIHGGTNAVAITVEFADDNFDTLSVHYDAVGNTWKSAGTVTKTGTLEWKKHTFYVSDAHFNDRQQGTYDFRISDDGNGREFISYVAVSRWDGARIKSNHLEINGKPTFLKYGLPLFDWSTGPYSLYQPSLSQLVNKGYNAVELNLYQEHFDSNGNGYDSLTHVNAYIQEAISKGLKVGFSVETYNVGGGGTPAYLFNWYNMQAYNSSSQPAIDTEYGTNKKIPSLYSTAFLNRTRNFMHWTLKNIDTSKITWFETTVEPQYIGNQLLDFSPPAYKAWRSWLARRYALTSLNSTWSTSYASYDQIPMPTNSSDKKWAIWQRWRSAGIARWINDDIQTIKNVVGEKALVAVDMLIVQQMNERWGDVDRVVKLVNPNVYQVNWHWNSGAAYDTGYNWCRPQARLKNIAMAEHMTLNGSDFSSSQVDAILKHTLTAGNKFGWHLVKFENLGTDSFALYNNDWSPKPLIKVLDSNNSFYLNLANSYLDDPL